MPHNARQNAQAARLRKRCMADMANTRRAASHHFGGRQACKPTVSPAAYANAAQSRGWRPAPDFGTGDRAFDCRFTGWPRPEGLTNQTEYAFHVVGLGKEINQVGLFHAISESQQAAKVTR